MKEKFSSRRKHYMKRASIFLITLALIAGMLGCDPATDPLPEPGDPIPHALNISSTAGGSVNVIIKTEEPGEHLVGPGESEVITDIPAGTEVDLTASPAKGYQFVEWIGAPVNGLTNPEPTINMQGNYEITAHFELIPPPPPTYELTMEADPEIGGTATDMTNGGPYAEGARIGIKAEANEGYQFVEWTAPAGEFDNVYEEVTTFTMPGENATVTANFELEYYELTMAVSPLGSGTATDETDDGPYTKGETINIKADANEGYQFVNWTATAGEFDNEYEEETTFTMPAENATVTANFVIEADPMVAAGHSHTVGLKGDGTVVATGDNDDGQCDVGDWTNIIQVAAGGYHTVGLQHDGTVVATGLDDDDQCDVGDWDDIIQVAAGHSHTVGLKSDGTVVAVGNDGHGRLDVGGWTGIVQVAAGYYHTVGLKDDGTVVAVGADWFGMCDVGDWENIIQISAGELHTVGLKDNNTVVAVGDDGNDQCDVGDWENIIQISAGYRHTVGLYSDGNVVAVGRENEGQCDVGDWEDIVQVAAGYRHTVGLDSNGDVFAVGLDDKGQRGVGGWNLN